MRMRDRGKRGEKALSRRLMFKGIGFFKLAAGLVVVASVLFLVPGLRFLAPGLEKMGTSQSQAMPPSEGRLGDKSSTQTEAKSANGLGGLTVANFGVGDFSSLLGTVEKNLAEPRANAHNIISGAMSTSAPFVVSGDLSNTGSTVELPQGVRLRVSQ